MKDQIHPPTESEAEIAADTPDVEIVQWIVGKVLAGYLRSAPDRADDITQEAYLVCYKFLANNPSLSLKDPLTQTAITNKVRYATEQYLAQESGLNTAKLSQGQLRTLRILEGVLDRESAISNDRVAELCSYYSKKLKEPYSAVLSFITDRVSDFEESEPWISFEDVYQGTEMREVREQVVRYLDSLVSSSSEEKRGRVEQDVRVFKDVFELTDYPQDMQSLESSDESDLQTGDERVVEAQSNRLLQRVARDHGLSGAEVTRIVKRVLKQLEISPIASSLKEFMEAIKFVETVPAQSSGINTEVRVSKIDKESFDYELSQRTFEEALDELFSIRKIEFKDTQEVIREYYRRFLADLNDRLHAITPSHGYREPTDIQDYRLAMKRLDDLQTQFTLTRDRLKEKVYSSRNRLWRMFPELRPILIEDRS